MEDIQNIKDSWCDEVVFEEAINKYLDKKEEITKSFIIWIIELWGILYNYREDFKQKRIWLSYCEKIGIHITTATQQIRLYEYSKKYNSSKALENVVTNWAKMQLFLSLPGEAKEEILENSEEYSDISSEEFKDKVIELWDETIEIFTTEKVIEGLEDLPGSTNCRDLSKLVTKQLWLSWESEKIIEGLLGLQAKTTKLTKINNSVSYEDLSDDTKTELKEFTKAIFDNISKIYKEINKNL